jgi:hypothetical protein
MKIAFVVSTLLLLAVYGCGEKGKGNAESQASKAGQKDTKQGTPENSAEEVAIGKQEDPVVRAAIEYFVAFYDGGANPPYLFLGMSSAGKQEDLDLPKTMYAHLKAKKTILKPYSSSIRRKGSRSLSELVDRETGELGMQLILKHVTLIGDDQAEVTLFTWASLGGAEHNLLMKKEDANWKVVGRKPGVVVD